MKMKMRFLLVTIVTIVTLIVLSAGCVSNVSVSYYVDDNLYAQLSLDRGITPPDDPVKDGYTFMGWYMDKDTWDKPFSLNSMLDQPMISNIKVYAYFVDNNVKPFNNYKVTVHPMGGSYVPNPKVLSNGKIEHPDVPVYGSRIFDGWYTSSTYEKKWDFDTDIVTEDIDLYAKWRELNSAQHYLDGYSVSKLGYIDGIYKEGDLVYIVYNIAKVTDVPVAVLTADAVENSGGVTIAASKGVADSSSISNSFEETITKSNGGNYVQSESSTITAGFEGNLFVPVKLELSGTSGFSYEKNWEHSKSTSESVSETSEHVNSLTGEYSADLADYPKGYLYRWVIKGDCIVSKTYIYNIKTHELKYVYDAKLIDDSLGKRAILEYSNKEDNFQLPTYNYDVTKIDTNGLFKGSGTENDPYLIYNINDLLLAPLAGDKHFKLMNNIPTDGYEWFDPANLKIEYGQYSIGATKKQPDESVSSSVPVYHSMHDIPLTQTKGVLAPGSYYLDSDITLDGVLEVKSGTVNLCLNGHKIIRSDKTEFKVTGGTLNLCDCGTGGKITSNGNNYGSGIWVESGSFNMYGGTISDNGVVADGAGVYITSGSMNMYGGTITNNNAAGGCGGGIFVKTGSLIMTGGTISGNVAKNAGGGVFLSTEGSPKPTFRMTGGTICDNKADQGAGVFLQKGTKMTMEGGSITRNVATKAIFTGKAGGVMVQEATFIITTGSITGNSATVTDGMDVYCEGAHSFSKDGGTIGSKF